MNEKLAGAQNKLELESNNTNNVIFMPITEKLNSNLNKSFYFLIKRFVDIIFSLLGLLLLSPILLIISVCIKLTSKGPVIYRNDRVGLFGNKFKLYKFRTMVNGAENLREHLTTKEIEEYQTNRKLKTDPRVTPIGKFLRSTSLDELPQLMNILKGEMSLVGPRPLLNDEIDMYGTNYNQYYVNVKPGLTGLWQVSGRNNLSFEDRVMLDEKYVKKMGVIFDFIIILKTFSAVLGKQGAF